MTLAEKLSKEYSPILDDINVNWKNNDRYKNYWELISKTGQLGPIKVITLRSGGSTYYVRAFGPIKHPNLSGKYLSLALEDRGSKTGVITHFYVSNEEPTNKDFSKFIKVPREFNSVKKVLALALGIGKKAQDMSANTLTDFNKKIDSQDNSHGILAQVEETWQTVELTLRIVFTSSSENAGQGVNGCIISGDPGVGKTYTVLKLLDELGMEEGVNYYYVQGAKLTLTTFYQKLYENSDKILIFDDSDAIFTNHDALNMIKAAIDTNARRTLTYESPVIAKMGLPPSFQFTGKLIILSNLPLDVLDKDKAARSRSTIISTHMTQAEKLAYIKSKITAIGGDYSHITNDDKIHIMELLEKSVREKGYPKQIDFRTLLKAYSIYNSIKQINKGDNEKSEKQLLTMMDNQWKNI